MLRVHHLENSRSQRLLWLLEELELPYELQLYRRNQKTLLAPPELKAVHPLGKSPVLSDGDAAGETVIAESGAIIDYVLERYGHGRLQPPAGTKEHLQYRYWLHYAEGSAMPLLVMQLVFSRLSQPPMPWLLRPLVRRIAAGVQAAYLAPQLKVHLEFIEAHLCDHAWFAGAEFSAADIQMSFPLEAAQLRARGRYPQIAAFLERIHSRPAYRKALEKGGPFSLPGA